MHSTMNMKENISETHLFFDDKSNLYASENQHNIMYNEFSSNSLMYAVKLIAFHAALVILPQTPVFDLFRQYSRPITK